MPVILCMYECFIWFPLPYPFLTLQYHISPSYVCTYKRVPRHMLYLSVVCIPLRNDEYVFVITLKRQDTQPIFHWNEAEVCHFKMLNWEMYLLVEKQYLIQQASPVFCWNVRDFCPEVCKLPKTGYRNPYFKLHGSVVSFTCPSLGGIVKMNYWDTQNSYNTWCT